MLFFHDTLGTAKGSETSVMARCGFNREFRRDTGYCIDAPAYAPAGSTVRIDPSRDDPFEPFAAPTIAHRY